MMSSNNSRKNDDAETHDDDDDDRMKISEAIREARLYDEITNELTNRMLKENTNDPSHRRLCDLLDEIESMSHIELSHLFDELEIEILEEDDDEFNNDTDDDDESMDTGFRRDSLLVYKNRIQKANQLCDALDDIESMSHKQLSHLLDELEIEDEEEDDESTDGKFRRDSILVYKNRINKTKNRINSDGSSKEEVGHGKGRSTSNSKKMIFNNSFPPNAVKGANNNRARKRNSLNAIAA